MSDKSRVYSAEELMILAARPRRELNPSEFLAVHHYENGYKGIRGSFITPDEDLYTAFCNDNLAWRSANQFKKAIGRAELSISHKRAAELYPVFMERLGVKHGI